MAIPGMSAGKLTAIVTANTAGLTTGLTRASAQVKAFSSGLQGHMAANSAAIAGMGKAIAGVGIAITALSFVSISRFAKFDKAMRQSTAVSKVTDEQFTEMSKMAEQASIEFNIAADKTARAFYFLGSAGLKAEEQIASFTSTALLSKAGVMEMGRSSEILVDTMKGFKIPFAESGRVVDVLVKGFISSNMTLTQLGETMSYVSGIARNTNNSLEDTVAVIGLMANVGIKGSMAGTSLRRALINLSAPTSGVRKELDKYVDVYDSVTGKMKSFKTILEELVPKLNRVSEEERNFALKAIFGARAITGMTELVYQGAEGLEEFSEQLRNSGGTAQEVADKQLAAFSEQIGIIMKKLDSFARMVGGQFAVKLSKLFMLPSENLAKLSRELKRFEEKGIELDKYVTEYETLKKKTELSKDEQLKLNKAIKEIALVVPGAITEVNKYGKAIGINTTRVKELYQAELQWIRSKHKEAIEDNIDAYYGYGAAVESSNKKLKDTKGIISSLKVELASYERQLKELEKANVFKNQQRILRTNIKLLKDKLSEALRTVNHEQRKNSKTLQDYNTKMDGTMLALVEYFDISQTTNEISRQLHEEFGVGIIKAHNLAIKLKELAIAVKILKDAETGVPGMNAEFVQEMATMPVDVPDRKLSTPNIWDTIAISVANAQDGLVAFNQEAKEINQTFIQMGELIKSSIADALADTFMGAKIAAEDFFKYLFKQLLKMGIMMGLTALFAPAAVASPIPLGFFGEEGGSFQNNDGNMNVSSLSNGTTGNQIQDNIPRFAQGVVGYQAPNNISKNNISVMVGGANINVPKFEGGISGYHVPDNIAMDTMPVMVGGGEELDVRSIGQVSERDNILRSQLKVLNNIVSTLYKTQTQIGDIAIHEANERGLLKKGASL